MCKLIKYFLLWGIYGHCIYRDTAFYHTVVFLYGKRLYLHSKNKYNMHNKPYL